MTGILHQDSWQPDKCFANAGGTRVIAVASGKGGVGKTCVSVNLGIALAKTGHRVVLCDADLGMSNAEVVLGVRPPYSLMDVVFGSYTITEVMTPVAGFQLISGGSGLAELANLNRLQRERLVREITSLKDIADYLVLDTGAGLSKTVLSFVAAAGEVIVVVTPEPTSLTDAYGLIKVLARYRVHREVMILINRVKNEKEGRMVFRRLAAVAGRYLPDIELKSAGHIREDPAVSQAVRSQVPLIVGSPHAPAARDLAEVAMGLTRGISSEQGIGGFVQKLFRLFG